MEAYRDAYKYQKETNANYLQIVCICLLYTSQVVYDAIERIQSMLPGGNGTLDFARLQTQMHALGDAVTRVLVCGSRFFELIRLDILFKLAKQDVYKRQRPQTPHPGTH